MRREVLLVPYDPAWPIRFETEARKIAPIFGSNLVRMHHIGSTAIPGILAKPIIDMLFEVMDIEQVDAVNEAAGQLGYQAMGEYGIPGRRYFRRLEGTVHLFHLHVFAVDDPEVTRHVHFRDYLRAHPEEAKAYQEIKVQLAETFFNDVGAYTDGKTTFIQMVDARAKTWVENR